jgi:hypothetical protein
MAVALQSAATVVPPSSSSIRSTRPMTANPRQTLDKKFVVDWNNPATVTSTINKTKTDDENLQEAFHRFRQQRMVCLI